jgi:hypothetical protein
MRRSIRGVLRCAAVSRISIDLVPRSPASLDAALRAIRERFPAVDTGNVPSVELIRRIEREAQELRVHAGFDPYRSGVRDAHLCFMPIRIGLAHWLEGVL